MTPLVLLHGFLGAPAAWDPVRAHLEPGRPVMAPALSGHGGGSAVTSWEEEVHRLLSIIDRARLTEVHLVGYSLGGRLALSMAALRPGLFSRLTLLSARLPLSTEAERLARRSSDAAWAARLAAEGVERFLDAWEAQQIFASQADLPAEVRSSWRAIRAAHDAATVAVGLGPLSLANMPPLPASLAHLSTPTMVLTGALDPKFCALAPPLAAALPRSAWQIVPGAGHNLPLEAPRAVAEALHWSPP